MPEISFGIRKARREVFVSRAYYLRPDQIDASLLDKHPAGSKEYQDNFDRLVMGVQSGDMLVKTMTGIEFLVDTSRWSPKEIDVVEVIDSYLVNFANHHENGHSLMLCGMLSPVAHSAVASGLVSYLLDHSDDINCMVISARDIIRYTNAAQFGKDDPAISSSLECALAADLVVIDKVGLEGISSDNSDSVLYEAMTRRLSLNLPTVVLSASPLIKRPGVQAASLTQRFGDQFVGDLALRYRIFDLKQIEIEQPERKNTKSKGRAW